MWWTTLKGLPIQIFTIWGGHSILILCGGRYLAAQCASQSILGDCNKKIGRTYSLLCWKKQPRDAGYQLYDAGYKLSSCCINWQNKKTNSNSKFPNKPVANLQGSEECCVIPKFQTSQCAESNGSSMVENAEIDLEILPKPVATQVYVPPQPFAKAARMHEN